MRQLSPDMSRQQAISLLAQAFAAAGLACPQLDARWLACAALDISHVDLVSAPDAGIGAGAPRLDDHARRRLSGEPVSRILGQGQFWGLALAVTPDVLDPRADTETLVRAALAHFRGNPEKPLRILDLGTGSGALLCALLTEWPLATGLAIDRSEAACRVARQNLASLGLAGARGRALVACGNWAAGTGGPYDLIVSNPPYIETAVIAGLGREVRDHDPWAALDGGTDGLACYRAIVAALPRLLAAGGLAILELGQAQAGAVAALALDCAMRVVDVRPDLSGIARAISLRHARARNGPVGILADTCLSHMAFARIHGSTKPLGFTRKTGYGFSGWLQCLIRWQARLGIKGC